VKFQAIKKDKFGILELPTMFLLISMQRINKLIVEKIQNFEKLEIKKEYTMTKFLRLLTTFCFLISISMFADTPKQAPKQEPKKEKAKKLEPKKEGNEEQKERKDNKAMIKEDREESRK
jgi:hypothetical protein